MAKVTEDGGIPEPEEKTPEVEWDDAFKEAEAKGDKAELSPADDPKNVPEGPEVIPPIPEKETPPELPAEIPPETPPDPALQKPGESDETFEQRWKTLQGIHRHDKETWETEKTTLLKDLETARKIPEPAKPTPAEIVADTAALLDSLTVEQKEALKEYEQDFDVVSKMEGIKREVELKKLRHEIDEKLAAIDTKVSARLEPVLKKAAESEEESHFDAIREVHGDYEQYVEDGSIVKWIESKPKYLQPALKQTYGQGSAEDAIDLIKDFKRENNIEPPPPPENVIPISKKKTEKRQALAAVDTRRGAISTQSAIKDDFEGAFDEALNK